MEAHLVALIDLGFSYRERKSSVAYLEVKTIASTRVPKYYRVRDQFNYTTWSWAFVNTILDTPIDFSILATRINKLSCVSKFHCVVQLTKTRLVPYFIVATKLGRLVLRCMKHWLPLFPSSRFNRAIFSPSHFSDRRRRGWKYLSIVRIII